MKQFEKILIGSSLGFALCKIIIFIWAADKGFDPTDESFLINGYRHWNLYNTFDYFKVLNLFFDTQQVSVYGYRMMRIVVELFSAIVFTCSFYFWYKNKAGERHVPAGIYFFCCSIAIFQSILFRSISYNEFVYLLIIISWSALLLCEIKKQSTLTALAYSLAGFLTSFLFFVKAPAAIAQILLLIVYSISALRIYSRKSTLLFWICFTLGLTGFLFTYLGNVSNIFSWFKNFLRLISLYRDMEYSITTLIIYMISEMGAYLLAFLVSVILLRLITAVFPSVKNKNLDWALHIIIVLLISSVPPYFLSMHSSFGVLHCFILVFAVVLYHINLPEVIRLLQLPQKGPASFLSHRTITLCIILLFHFVIVGGSVVSFSEMFFFFQTPALLVLVVPTYEGFIASSRMKHYFTLLSALLVLMISVFVFFNVIHPSGLAENLFAQNTKAEIYEDLLLDKTSCQTLDSIHAVLSRAGFHRGQPIVSFDYFCGIAYLQGAYSPGCACYPPTTDRKEKFNCYFLQSIETSTLPDTIPVLYSTDKSLETLRCFGKGAKKYRYQLLDSVFNGYSLNEENKILMGEQSREIKIGLLIADN